MDIPLIDVNKLCRLCCEEGICISLFNVSYQISVTDMIMQCTNVKISNNDGLPTCICNNCLYRLECSFQFKEQCETSDLRLREYLGIGISSIGLENQGHIALTKHCITDKNDCPAIHEITGPTISDSSTQVKDEEIYAAMNVISSFLTDQPNLVLHDQDNGIVLPSNNSASTNDIMKLGTSIPLVNDSSLLDGQALDDVHEIIINSEKNIHNIQTDAIETCGEELVVKSEKLNDDNNNLNNSTNKKSKKELNVMLENHKLKQKKEKGKDGNNCSKNNKLRLKIPEQCFECGKLFYYPRYLEAHLRTHTGERPFECNVCKRSFTQTGNLALHMRIHTGERPFQCEICSKMFTTSSNLTAHQRIHSDVRSFICKHCPLAFRSHTDVLSHEGTHTGIKNHICKLCGKAFYKIAYLNVHLRAVHIGEKRYSCSECGKEFANSSNLNCHVRIHTGEKPFSCNYCSAKFNQSSSLIRHKKKHLNSKPTIDNKPEVQIEKSIKVENATYISVMNI